MDGSVLHRILLGLVGGYLSLNLFALFGSNRLIFVPRSPSYAHLPHEIRITTRTGEQINAVFLENPTAKHTLLFSHGNAEDLGHVVGFMQQFHELGYSVLMYDYRGYGTSEGTPSAHKTKQDIEAAYHWLVEKKNIAPETIIAQGRSLGGAPATWLAAHYPLGGLVIESTFVSAFRVKTHWPLLPWDKFNTLRQIKKVRCPTLVVHGTEDEVIPFWHGEKLYAAAPSKKMSHWVRGGHHNDYAYVAGADYLRVFQEFVGQLVDD